MSSEIQFERLRNFRDLGGVRGADGRVVRRGRLYRSDSLAKVSDTDWLALKALGIRSVIDLRYPWEIAAAGRAPKDEDISWFNFSIEHRPYDQTSLEPSVDVVAYLGDRFGEVITDGVVELRQTLLTIADASHAPLVFHCASGKDRTAIVAALVLSLLGVGDDDIVADFVRTEQARDQLLADWATAHPGRVVTWPSYGRTPAALMRRFLADLRDRYGSVRELVTNVLGVDDTAIAQLQRTLLEPAAPSDT